MTRLRVLTVTPVLLSGALLLSACASPAAKTSSPAPKITTSVTYLCQVTPRVHRLIVTRHAPGHQFTFTFPPRVNVTSAVASRAVASAACALPDFASGVYHCPAAFAVTYHLVFAVMGEKGTGGEAIDLYPTGCPMVKGLGDVRAPTPSFYRVLTRAMKLTNVGHRTLTGTFTNGA